MHQCIVADLACGTQHMLRHKFQTWCCKLVLEWNPACGLLEFAEAPTHISRVFILLI